MFKVYITDHVFADIAPSEKVLGGIAQVIPLQCKSTDELILKAADADAIMNTYLDKINGDVMDAMPNLRAIVRCGIGFNTIDTEAAAARGIPVANVPDYCIDEVADHAVAHVLNLVRKLSYSNKQIQNGDYALSYVNPILPLRDARTVIAGFGRIGRKIAERLAVFGCDLAFYDPFIPGDISLGGITVRKVDFDTMCMDSDIIILQSPLTKENFHMFNAEAFAKMRRKPYIVNTARGELIDTLALIQALKSGAVSGAGLDVWEGDQAAAPAESAKVYRDFDNVVLTPHSAWVSENSSIQLQQLAAEEVARALRSQPIKNSVNGVFIKK